MIYITCYIEGVLLQGRCKICLNAFLKPGACQAYKMGFTKEQLYHSMMATLYMSLSHSGCSLLTKLLMVTAGKVKLRYTPITKVSVRVNFRCRVCTCGFTPTRICLCVGPTRIAFLQMRKHILP